MCRPLVLVPNKHKESEKQSLFCRIAHSIKYSMNQALQRSSIKLWELEIQEKAPEISQIEQLLLVQNTNISNYFSTKRTVNFLPRGDSFLSACSMIYTASHLSLVQHGSFPLTAYTGRTKLTLLLLFPIFTDVEEG